MIVRFSKYVAMVEQQLCKSGIMKSRNEFGELLIHVVTFRWMDRRPYCKTPQEMCSLELRQLEWLLLSVPLKVLL